MTRLTVIGMVITVFTLAGCVDERDVQSLRDSYISLSNEAAYFRARMTAVEEACLQLNARLLDSEGRKTASAQSPVSAPAQQTEQLALLSGSPAKLTRNSFSHRLIGMTQGEVLAMFGKPDKISEDAGIQCWTYNAVRLTAEDGKPEASPALIVFETGCVSRAVLTGEVQYSSEPKGKEPENTAVNSNITAATNSTVDTNQ